jgi:hypothetical protein
VNGANSAQKLLKSGLRPAIDKARTALYLSRCIMRRFEISLRAQYKNR